MSNILLGNCSVNKLCNTIMLDNWYKSFKESKVSQFNFFVKVLFHSLKFGLGRPSPNLILQGVFGKVPPQGVGSGRLGHRLGL